MNLAENAVKTKGVTLLGEELTKVAYCDLYCSIYAKLNVVTLLLLREPCSTILQSEFGKVRKDHFYIRNLKSATAYI